MRKCVSQCTIIVKQKHSRPRLDNLASHVCHIEANTKFREKTGLVSAVGTLEYHLFAVCTLYDFIIIGFVEYYIQIFYFFG